MSGTITHEEVSCFYMINHALKSHRKLSSEDVKFASNYICSMYVHYSQQPNSEPFDEFKLLMFLAYTNQKGVCKFALLYNTDLDRVIMSRDKKSLKKLLTGMSEELFVELYNNPFLSQEDKEAIERSVVKEYYAVKLALESLREKLLNFEDLDQLTLKCYGNVCVQDSKLLNHDKADAIFSKHECSPEKVYTVDKAGERDPAIYCFDALNLLEAVTNKIPINPITNHKFSAYTLELINRRFRKEILLYKRYRQLRR